MVSRRGLKERRADYVHAFAHYQNVVLTCLQEVLILPRSGLADVGNLRWDFTGGYNFFGREQAWRDLIHSTPECTVLLVDRSQTNISR